MGKHLVQAVPFMVKKIIIILVLCICTYVAEPSKVSLLYYVYSHLSNIEFKRKFRNSQIME